MIINYKMIIILFISQIIFYSFMIENVSNHNHIFNNVSIILYILKYIYNQTYIITNL